MGVTLYMAISADGFIADLQDNTPWSEDAWVAFKDFVKTCDVVLLGRRTYEIMTAQDEFVDGTEYIVVTRNSRLKAGGLRKINIKSAEDMPKAYKIGIIGGGDFNGSLAKLDLLDEIILDIEPIMLGNGKRLFGDYEAELNLKLISSHKFGSGTVQNHYKVLRDKNSRMQAAFEEIYQAHSPSIRLGNLDKPALIVFSAIPGSGKSELTKRLVEDHGVTSIANKDIRKSLEQTGHTDDVVIGEYTLWLLDKLTKQKPRTIVFDRNIDQWYEAAKDWADKNNYRLLLVQIEVSRSTLEKRLHHREGGKVSKVLGMLDFYQTEHGRIAPNMQPDILLKEDYDLDAAARVIVDTITEGGR